jgi:predicted transcriptional regulator
MRYRSRLDIISSVMRVASRNGASRTRIMYGAYISSRQAKEYLALLTEQGLVAYDGSGQVYKLTDRGRQFLKAADRMGRLVGPESEVRATQDTTIPSHS